ncbi:MAG: carboxypeptidase regulatory-like domain-containing protein [Planctomycetes bacterium]|nr:carboxypeptidase regulatory-like domain-containing protein [Planctomycetota bacterium]
MVGPEGKPVDDAIIVVNERRNVFSDRGSPFHTPVSEVVSVDANGEFEIQRREGHVYVIHVQAETYARESVNLYATRTHQVTLTSAATVAGKVTDLLTHAVLPGANVLLQMGVTSQPLTATTDERGGFHFTGVRAGDGYLEVSHPRYKPRRIQLNSITPGGMSYKAVGLALGGHLEGTVTVGSTEASLPPEVPVLVSAYDRFRMQSAGVVSASSGGDFSFDSLYPGGQYVLTATAPGYGAATATVNLPVSGTVPPVHLVLDDEWVFEGVVTDSFGAPLRNCRIDLLIPALTSEDPVSRDTDEFGRFQIEGMGAHAYRLIASHPDHALEEISPITRALHENGVQITLQTGGVVTADVTGPAGNPVMAALVRLSVHDSNGQLIGPRLFGYTTNRGTFRMDHVPFGNVTLRIFAAGYGPYGEQFLLSGEGAMVHRYITLLLE